MPLLAAGIYLDFLLLIIGWRAYRSYRLTGDHGLRLFRADASMPNKVAVWLVVWAGFFYSISAPLVRREWLSLYSLPVGTARYWLAGGLMLMGVLITVVAQLQMGHSWRIGVDPEETTPLVCAGLFRWSRNPIYLGVLVFWLGNFLLMPNIVSGLALCAGWVALQMIVRLVEEPFMLAKHGEAYASYGESTGRFVPGLGLLHSQPEVLPAIDGVMEV